MNFVTQHECCSIQQGKNELLRARGDQINLEKVVEKVNDRYYMKEYFMNKSRYKN